MPPAGLYRLLEALEERSVPLRHDDIAWAFESEKTRRFVVDWMREYLGPTNLLTKEEVKFHETAPSHAVKAAKPISRPIQDIELEAAVASLEASTAAIDKQCLLLEEQKRAFAAFKTQNATDSNSTIQGSRQTKLQREQARLDFEIRELSDGLTARLRQAGKVAGAAEVNLPNAVTRGSERDDRLLDGLAKLDVKVAGGGDERSRVEEVEELCMCLSSLLAAEIKGKVDEAYLSNQAQGGDDTRTNNHRDTERVATLRAELDDLSSEIDGLVSIVVDQQYRQSITSSLKNSDKRANAEQQRWTGYVCNSLHHLASKAEAADSYTQQLQAFNSTVRQMQSALHEVTTGLGANQDSVAARSASPEKQSKGLKPLRLLQRTSSPAHNDPVTRMLQHLSLPSLPANTANDTAALDAYLEETVVDLPEGQPTAEIMNRAIAQHLVQTSIDQEALLNAVYMHSYYSEPRLADQGLVIDVERLEAKTKGLGDEMRRFDHEAKLVEVKAMARDLVQKQGSS